MSEQQSLAVSLVRVAVALLALLLGAAGIAQVWMASQLNRGAETMLAGLSEMNRETAEASGPALQVAGESAALAGEIRSWTAEMVFNTEALLPGLENSVAAASEANRANDRALAGMDELLSVLREMSGLYGSFIDLTAKNVQLNGVTISSYNPRFRAVIQGNIAVLEQMDAALDTPVLHLYFWLRGVARRAGAPLPGLGI
jgi:hypothetical protein